MKVGILFFFGLRCARSGDCGSVSESHGLSLGFFITHAVDTDLVLDCSSM